MKGFESEERSLCLIHWKGASSKKRADGIKAYKMVFTAALRVGQSCTYHQITEVTKA